MILLVAYVSGVVFEVYAQILHVRSVKYFILSFKGHFVKFFNPFSMRWAPELRVLAIGAMIIWLRYILSLQRRRSRHHLWGSIDRGYLLRGYFQRAF